MSDSDTEKKNKLVAALLAFFLGTFGIHKFYMGETGKGIFYLLFCWTGIPTILGVIECIDYLLISNKQFQSRCKYKINL
ncbi:MAG: TM2 domain-containing protein [Candidatus Shapirobacteria bacterium]|nr:TM2 domain-containing protein [Candidatus Shapirobacteria bacterium]MDD4410428.1 TM2 domain-containing protein [Candidatus Shapirobacteria bacterium]